MVVVKIPTMVMDQDGATLDRRRRSLDSPVQVVVDSLDWKTTMLLEFQGTIQMDGASWQDQVLGNLSLVDGTNKAVLIIGNHRLEGKVVKLDRPQLLIRKQQPPQQAHTNPITTTATTDQINNAVSAAAPPPAPVSTTGDMDLDPEEEALLRRAVDMSRGSVSSPSSSQHGRPLSEISSAAPTSGPLTSGMDMDSAESKASPSSMMSHFKTIEYETVAVIRQKILFNAMPQAIIKEERRGLTIIKRGI